MTVPYVVASYAYALLCMVPASMKLAGTAKMRAAAEHFGISWNRYRVVGILEVAASVGVAAGLCWRAIGLAAALGMITLLVGAVLCHRRAHDEVSEYVAALVFLAASVAYVGLWIASLP